MISENCDIREFICELENKDFFEMIYLLDKEATEVERQLFNPKSSMSERQICGPEYVSNLKNLIFLFKIWCPTQRIETGRFKFASIGL